MCCAFVCLDGRVLSLDGGCVDGYYLSLANSEAQEGGLLAGEPGLGVLGADQAVDLSCGAQLPERCVDLKVQTGQGPLGRLVKDLECTVTLLASSHLLVECG